MKQSMLTFPLIDKQICSNCKIILGIDKLSSNVLDVVQDASGMPAVMVRCPVCKTILEWETKGN